MKREPKHKKFLTDAELGIRRLPQIENLPVKELTDSEICKLFFDRFDADALLLIYFPRDQGGGLPQLFGRVRMKGLATSAYRRLLTYFQNGMGFVTNNREIPEEEF